MFSKKQITTIGSTSLDILYYTETGRIIENPKDVLCNQFIAFEQGAKVIGQKIYFTPGGSAANTAVTFQRLGLQPQIFSILGSDVVGVFCLRQLKKENLSTIHIQRTVKDTTNTSFIVNLGKHNNHVKFVYRGASEHLDCAPHRLRFISTPWVYITALSGNWKLNLKHIFARVRVPGGKIAWNPGSEQIMAGTNILRTFLKETELLLLNSDEAAEFLMRSHIKIPSSNARVLARALYRFGPRMVVVTMGHRGAVLFDGKKMFFQPAKKSHAVSKTGAGDAFGSGLVAGILKYRDISRSLRLAMYNSASVVAYRGAQEGILRARDLHSLNLS